MKKIIPIIILAVIAACGPKNKDKKNPEVKDSSSINIDVPAFNSDSAFLYVEKQVAFGPRVPGTKSHSNCAAWLKAELKRHGAEVTGQPLAVKIYNNKVVKGENIIGSFNTGNPKRIMLSSHWDSRPFSDYDVDPKNHDKAIDGANDGASGVGVLLEVARCLAKSKPAIGVDIVFWDVEDWGEPKDAQNVAKEDTWGLGSQFWSKNPHKTGYSARYGILLDMVGAANATFYMEGFSQQFAPNVVKKVWDVAASLGNSQYFIYEEANPIMDDHYYVNKYANIPTIDIIHQDKSSRTGFYPYWHTQGDKMDKIDRKTLGVVGETLLYTIFREQ